MMEGIFICAAPHCLKSFLKKTDFEAHVHSVHANLVNSNPQKDVNESEAASAKKPTTSDSTVQAPTPRPVQDGEDRTQPRSQPQPQPQPLSRPLIQPNLNPQPNGMNPLQPPYVEYPMNTLQPPNFVVPVNPNVMGTTSFSQPLYVGPQTQEAGVEQGTLMGYPQPWNVGPNGAPFDPSMMMNQGGFFQGGPPPHLNIPLVGNGNNDSRQPPPLPPPFTQMPGGTFFAPDSSHHGQGYVWQQDKRDSFGNGQD